MSPSSFITPADLKIDKAIRLLMTIIWGVIIIFGILTIIQPVWLQNLSEPGKEAEAIDLKNMGDVFLKEKNYQKAITLYQTALEIYPELSSAYGNLAICYAQLGKADMAEDIIMGLIERLPERDYIGYQNLGDMYFNQKEYDKARRFYQKSRRSHPFPAEVIKFIGFCSKELGEKEKALKYYNHSITEMTSFELLYRGSIKNEIYKHREAEYSDKLKKLLNDANEKLNLSHYCEKALHYINSKDPEIAKIYNEIGIIYYQMGDIKSAKLSFERGLKIDPSNQNMIRNLRSMNQQSKN